MALGSNPFFKGKEICFLPMCPKSIPLLSIIVIWIIKHTFFYLKIYSILLINIQCRFYILLYLKIQFILFPHLYIQCLL